MKKKRGFTDKCFVFFTCVWVLIVITAELLTVFSCKLSICDLSVINTIVEKSTEAMMVYIGFNVWKTKSENMKKLGCKDNITME